MRTNSARGSVRMLTLVVQVEGEYLGFGSLKDNKTIDMLYVHPDFAGEGVGTAIAGALEKIAGARGAEAVTVDVSDTAVPFFEGRGYVGAQRNSIPLDDQWLSNTTMIKRLASSKSETTSRRETVMSKERLYLFDTTLRDGAQTTGVDFSLEDKRRIAAVLDDLGIDYIEGGYPGANATDTELLPRGRLQAARFTAFGMTKRSGRSVSNDPGLQAILQSSADSDLPRRQGRGTITCASRSASPTRRTSTSSSSRCSAVVETHARR